MPWANIITAAATLIAAYLGAILAQWNQAREFKRQAREKHRLEQRDVILALANATVSAQGESERAIELAEERSQSGPSVLTRNILLTGTDRYAEQVQLARARMDALTEELRRARLIITDTELRGQVDELGAHASVYVRYVVMITNSIAEPEKLLQSKTAAEKHRKAMVAALQLLSEDAAVRLSPTYQTPKAAVRHRIRDRWRKAAGLGQQTPLPMDPK